MRIRFFSAYDEVAPCLRGLMPELAARGHDVEMIVARTEHRAGRGLERALAGQLGIRLRKVGCLGLKPRGRAKLAVFGLYTFGAAVRALFGRAVDLNVFLTQPPLIHLLGWLLKRARGQPYGVIVMDLHPDILVQLGMLRGESRFVTWSMRLGRRALREASRVIVIGRCMAETLAAAGVSRDRLEVIPNWADEREIWPVKHADNGFRRRRDWDDRFVVMFAGNLGMPQYFDDVLAVARSMAGEPRVRFVFIGDGVRRTELVQRVAELELANVEVLPFQHEQFPLSEILSAADLHLITLRHECTGMAVPSKSYPALAAGRPLLYQGDATGEIARMIVEEDVGDVCDCGDEASLERYIRRSFGDPELRRARGERGRQLTLGRYGRATALDRYARALCELS